MIPIKIGTEIKQIKGIYYKIGNEVKRLLVKSKIDSEIKDFIKYTIQKLLTYDFVESTSQSMSNTFNFPNLISVDEVTVDNGNVTYTKKQDNVNVNVNNGTVSKSVYDSQKYSMSKEDYRDSSSNSFASSISCSSDGYSGTLYASGSSYVSSGSYTPADSKTVTENHTASQSDIKKWNGTNWVDIDQVITGDTSCSPITYNSGGYSGTLSYVGKTATESHFNPAPTNPVVGQTYVFFYQSGYFTFNGTVTRPATDTRVYRQKYNGYLYQGGYTNYYKYKINIKYTIKN